MIPLERNVSLTEIASAAIDPLVPTHVGVFLAKAFSAIPGAGLQSRPDIHKCAGTNLAGCATCIRKLAPAGAGQQWAEPQISGEVCSMFASIEQYGDLFGASSQGGSNGEVAQPQTRLLQERGSRRMFYLGSIHLSRTLDAG
jgi:hypothetical protein